MGLKRPQNAPFQKRKLYILCNYIRVIRGGLMGNPDYMESFNDFEESIIRGDIEAAKSQKRRIELENHGYKAEEHMKKQGINWSYKDWLNEAENDIEKYQ